ncbi:MAG: ABC transporter substrate-binding protein, partial [Proteobacteria bacterium]|nr:ABC transporter substrate-binding protein [Pseudomonadota bacterium]
MKNLIRTAVAAGALALAASAPAAAAAPESDEPIILTLHDWSGQYITTTIMGNVLKSMGYNVEYVQADYLAQFAGIETGDLTVAMELWDTTAAEALAASIATSNTIDLGETGMEAKEEWWYPIYMKELCPGLPDWQALNACAELFATPETGSKGRYLGGPVTWGGWDDERVEALNMDFEVIHAGTDAALFAELESAYQRKAPFLGWVYAPHWAPAKYEGEWVEFPPYSAECYNDPSVGLNPDMAYDCGKPSGLVRKAGWAGGEAVWPCAYQAIRAFRMDNATMGELVAEVDLEGVSVDDAVNAWMDANEATWQSWTACEG